MKAEATTSIDATPMTLLEIRDLHDPLGVGHETDYEIRIVNQGLVAGSNLRLVVVVPPGLVPVEGTGPSAALIEGQRVVFAPLPRLAIRAEVLYRVKVRAVRAGDWSLLAQLTSDQLRRPLVDRETTRVWGR